MTATSPTITEVARATASNPDHSWYIRLENTTTRNAFYEASGVGRGNCTIRWGKIGSAGQSRRYTYSETLNKLGQKLAKGYEYAGTAGKPPKTPRQRKQENVRTMRWAMGNATMRPVTQMELLDLAARETMSPLPHNEDYTDIFKNADKVTLMRSNRGVVWVVVRYGQDLVCGRLDFSY